MEMPRTALLAWAMLPLAVVMYDSSCFQDFATGRLYRTKYEVCNGHAGNELVELTNVSLSAPYHRRLRRHVFWRLNQVHICIAGRAGNLTGAVPFLQNAASGIPPLIPINFNFCDMNKDTCNNMEPACGSSRQGCQMAKLDPFP